MLSRMVFANRVHIAAALVLIVLIGLGATTQAQERFRISFSTIVAAPGEQAMLEVSMANPVDTITWIMMAIDLSECDIAQFVAVTGDYGDIVELDTVGTLFSGTYFETYAHATGTRFFLDAFPGLMPQPGGVLFRVPIQMAPTMPAEGTQWTEVGIPIHDLEIYAPLEWMSDWFNILPRIPGTSYDTTCWMCTMPDPHFNLCHEWERVDFQCEIPEDYCDSVHIETHNWVVDETQMVFDNGRIGIRARRCGDVNWDGVVRISDISLIIDHLFLTNAPIDPIAPGNTNCSVEQPVVLTIGDISALIDHLFINREPLCCE